MSPSRSALPGKARRSTITAETENKLAAKQCHACHPLRPVLRPGIKLEADSNALTENSTLAGHLSPRCRQFGEKEPFQPCNAVGFRYSDIVAPKLRGPSQGFTRRRTHVCR